MLVGSLRVGGHDDGGPDAVQGIDGVDRGMRADHVQVTVLQRLRHLVVVHVGEHQILRPCWGSPVVRVRLQSDVVVLPRLELVAVRGRDQIGIGQLARVEDPAAVPEISRLLDRVRIAAQDRLSKLVGGKTGLLGDHMGRERGIHHDFVVRVIALELHGEGLAVDLTLRPLRDLFRPHRGDMVEDSLGILVRSTDQTRRHELGVLGGPGQQEVVDGDRGSIRPRSLVGDGVLHLERVLADCLERTEFLVLADGAVSTEVPEITEKLINDHLVVDGVRRRGERVVGTPVSSAGAVDHLTIGSLLDTHVPDAWIVASDGGLGGCGLGIVFGLVATGTGTEHQRSAHQHSQGRLGSPELHVFSLS